jgi:RND family efflux transporter MFP subunit
MNRRAQGLVRWVVLAVVVLAAGLAGLAVWRNMRPVVTVTEAVEGPAVQAFYATGTVAPEHEYPIKSNIAGIVTSVLVDKGDRVNKGQPLAMVTDPDLEFKAKQAAAELEEKRLRADAATSPVLREFDERIKLTRDMLDLAGRDQQRFARIAETSAGVQMELERAIDKVKALNREIAAAQAQRESKKLELQKELQVAQAAMNSANWNLEQQTLKSPIDGVVLDRPVTVGTRLAINDHVMQVADVSQANLVMRAQVDEEYVAGVRPDPDHPQPVVMTLYSFPGQVFRGAVSKVYDKADAERRTFEVDVKLPKAEGVRFQPGMTGELAFVVDSKPRTLVVPSQAVQGGRLYTVADGRLKLTSAEIGIRGVERTEILTGMRPGERVVISPVTDLRDGQAVRPTFMDPVAAAGLNKPKEKEIFRGGF